jgi:hypothetical protein
MIAMVAPEIVLLRAISQWETARKLRDQRNAVLEQRTEEMSAGGNEVRLCHIFGC